MAGYTSMGYSYDATGAITSTTRNGTTHYLTYGAQGHVSQLIPNRASGPWAVRYTYNGIGQRILKTDARTGIADLRIEHTLYSDEDATQVLGSYRNKRSLDSAAPQGEGGSNVIDPADSAPYQASRPKASAASSLASPASRTRWPSSGSRLSKYHCVDRWLAPSCSSPDDRGGCGLSAKPWGLSSQPAAY